VVSDQYASKTVTAGGVAHTGIVAKDADGNLTVLQSDGRKFEVKAGEVEDLQPSKVSAMPEGLANRLTLEQLGDLFAYLTGAPEPNIAGRDTGKVR
jgi:putative heme-binding domain-containing protein